MSSEAFEEGNAYQSLQMVLQEAFGIVIGEERKSMITAKLKPVMSEFNLDTLNKLVDSLKNEGSAELRNAVLQAITEHEDDWFSPDELFNLLDEYLLPDMLETDRKKYRIWVISSGAGQLPYSLAMKIRDAMNQSGAKTKVTIEATDISESVVSNAANGVFEQVSMKGMEKPYQQKYMDEKSGQWQVSDEIKDMVSFSTCNLLDDFEDKGYFDLIICQDVLAYFSLAIKQSLLSTFAKLLDPSGILIAGATEPIMPLDDSFELVRHEAGMFYRQKS